MPSDPLKHSLDHFHAEIAADPGIRDAMARLNELHVPDPREQRFGRRLRALVSINWGLLAAVAACIAFWAGMVRLIANWNW